METEYTSPSEQADPSAEPHAQAEMQIEPSVAAYVKKWTERVNKAKAFHKDAFKRMRDDQKFAANYKNAQWEGAPDKYVANLTFRHVQQTVATCYAKNPRVKATRRRRREFALWDEDPQTLVNAQVVLQQAQMQPDMPPPPNAQQCLAVLKDAMDGMNHIKMLNGLGETLEILYHYEMDSHVPSFKLRMKQMIRRGVTCGVGYVTQHFQRTMEKNPATIEELADLTRRLAHIGRMQAETAELEYNQDDAEAEELRAAIEALQKSAQANEVVSQERIMWDFPRSTAVIPDPRTTSLTEFDGAHWVAIEYYFTPDEVEEIFDVDVCGKFTPYKYEGVPVKGVDASYAKSDAPAVDGDLVCCYGVLDKDTGTEFFIADGYKGYLRAPAPPAVTLDRFFNIYTWVPNQDENEFDLFPPSDVQLIKPAQQEFNRSRDGLREHRRINRPFTAAASGAIEEEDKDKLRNRQPFEVIFLNGLMSGAKVEDLLQQVPGAPIDPNMYDTGQVFDDMQKTVGSQEANFGSTSGSTATESAIAETSRVSSMDSKIDDLNDMLSMMAKDGGRIMLANLSKETALKIAGPGAIWADQAGGDMTDLIGLDVVAGSSGRPNKAIDVANFERMAPLLMQIPGINPTWFAKEGIKRLDDKLDLVEALASGLPSIIAMNGAAGKAGPADGQGAVGKDQGQNPGAQGSEGAQNAPQAPQTQGGPQPAMPSGAAPPGAPGAP